jgi:hypothetical protein
MIGPPRRFAAILVARNGCGHLPQAEMWLFRPENHRNVAKTRIFTTSRWPTGCPITYNRGVCRMQAYLRDRSVRGAPIQN